MPPAKTKRKPTEAGKPVKPVKLTKAEKDKATKAAKKLKKIADTEAKAVATKAAEDAAALAAELQSQAELAVQEDDDTADLDYEEDVEVQQEPVTQPILEKEGATENELCLDRQMALHVQNLYVEIIELRETTVELRDELARVTSRSASDMLDELLQEPDAIRQLFMRMGDHLSSDDSSITEAMPFLQDMIRSGAEQVIKTKKNSLDKFITTTKVKIDEIDVKASELKKKLGSMPSQSSSRPHIMRIDPPSFTTVTASTSEGLEKFFQDLALQNTMNGYVSEEHKCAFFLSTLCKKSDADTVSMVTTIRAAVSHNAVGTPPDESPFAYIKYVDLVKAVKQAFSKTDTQAKKAKDFLAFQVGARDSFSEAARDYFTAVKGSFAPATFTEKMSVDMIRTQLLLAFEGTFPKTTEQFRTRLALMESTDDPTSWNVDSLEKAFRDSNNSTQERTARPVRPPFQKDRSSTDRATLAEARVQHDLKRRTALGMTCHSCGMTGHFANDCRAKKPKHFADRSGKMVAQSPGAFSKFSNINSAVVRERFASEKNCAYHVTDGHSVAECEHIKSHRQQGYLWCNSCASMNHDTTNCPGKPRPRPPGGGWNLGARPSPEGRAWGKSSRD